MRTIRKDRNANNAHQQVQRSRQTTTNRAVRRAHQQHTKRLQRDWHRRKRKCKRDLCTQREEQRASDNEQGVGQKTGARDGGETKSGCVHGAEAINLAHGVRGGPLSDLPLWSTARACRWLDDAIARHCWCYLLERSQHALATRISREDQQCAVVTHKADRVALRRCAQQAIVRNLDHQTIRSHQHYAVIRHQLLLDPPATTTSNAECDRTHGSKDQQERPWQRRRLERTHEHGNRSDYAIGQGRWMSAVAVNNHRVGPCERRSHQPNVAQRAVPR